MLNTLDDYIPHSLPAEGAFHTHPNLARKVGASGDFLPFWGNTVVFLLEKEVQQKLERLRDTLYEAAGEMLAEPLHTDTFHMTLHDLANGQPDQPGLGEWMRQTEEKARDILKTFSDPRPLPMRGTWLFNMMNTSIVLGLAPGDEETVQRLDGMYTVLEQAQPLSYALTPHITMAYFRPGQYTQEQVRRLAAVLHPVELELPLKMEQLVLQFFKDMNHYE